MTDAQPPRFTSVLPIVLVAWLLASLILIAKNWTDIGHLDMPDTDDAQRLLQVRDWLAGQPWGDITQYRMNPPTGAEMHWSRLVDLPIAGAILALDGVAGRVLAERIAVTVTPLLALLLAACMAALAAFRLANRDAAILAGLFLIGNAAVVPLFAPLRVDHHGWQVALLLVFVAMFVDPAARRRSGLIAGLSAALSLNIGVEMLPHIVMASLVLVFAWCLRPGIGAMVSGYGLTLATMTAALYLPFVPVARWWAPACDAMSPVYLLAAIAGGGAMALLPRIAKLDSPWQRAAAALLITGGAGGIVLALYPECARGPLGGLDPAFLPVLERISEAQGLLDVAAHRPGMVAYLGIGPLVAMGAAAFMRHASPADQRFGWNLLLALLATTTLIMLLQVRAMSGPNAIATIASAALASHLLPKVRAMTSLTGRVIGTIVLFGTLTSGLPILCTVIVAKVAATPASESESRSLATCTSAQTLAPLLRMPPTTIANVIDMGPAILLHTPHTVIAGPYHRSAPMIVDSVALWRADDARARAITARYGVHYLVGCVVANDLAHAKKTAPDGLWARLTTDSVPDWLEPVAVPDGSPLRIYRVRY